ncbi:MAG: DMT family transporter [Acidobacteriota bacterium]
MSNFLDTLQSFSYLGEVLSLSAALLWAVAIIFFRLSGKTVHPLGLNFFKNLLSFLLIGLTMLIGQEVFFPAYSERIYILFIISGIIGLGLSDTLLFSSLNRLGAGLLAIVYCTYSPFIILLSLIFLGERMRLIQFFGVALIVLSVWVISGRSSRKTLSQKSLTTGIVLGLGAMLSQAVSIVIIKPYLAQTPLLWATQIRTLGGILGLMLVLQFHKEKNIIRKTTFSLRNWRHLFPGAFIGSYIAIIAWMGGMKYTLVSIAASLNQTNTAFLFLFGILFLGEKPTPGKLLSFLAASTGVCLVMLF